jgi:hypothetical protein
MSHIGSNSSNITVVQRITPDLRVEQQSRAAAVAMRKILGKPGSPEFFPILFHTGHYQESLVLLSVV